MIYYLDDDDKLNLSHVPQLAAVRNTSDFKIRYLHDNVTFKVSKSYDRKGLYPIEVSKFTHQWTGKSNYGESFDLIAEIPQHVVNAVIHGKLRILIIATIEGDSYLKRKNAGDFALDEDYDAFEKMHNSMLRRGLPPKSIIIASGNLLAKSEYNAWCYAKKKDHLLEFVEGIEHDFKDNMYNQYPSKPVVFKSFNKKAYNSLNRAPRHHRTEHLYLLAKDNLLESGLVSGGSLMEDKFYSPLFIDVNDLKDIFDANFPKIVDVNTANENPANILNFDIYENSQLSVVTESFFAETGLFITEKTFRPIAIGSPCIVLGQPFLLKKLKRHKLDLYFEGLDQSYDEEIDPKIRLQKFHNTLKYWCNLTEEQRQGLIISWQEQLIANIEQHKRINFKQAMLDRVEHSSLLYFHFEYNR